MQSRALARRFHVSSVVYGVLTRIKFDKIFGNLPFSILKKLPSFLTSLEVGMTPNLVLAKY